MEYRNEKTKNDSIRQAIVHHLRDYEAQFVVCGLEEGMSAQLLGDEKDVSFRQAYKCTPIIVKEHNFIPDPSARWAISVDMSEDSEHSFDVKCIFFSFFLCILCFVFSLCVVKNHRFV